MMEYFLPLVAKSFLVAGLVLLLLRLAEQAIRLPAQLDRPPRAGRDPAAAGGGDGAAADRSEGPGRS